MCVCVWGGGGEGVYEKLELVMGGEGGGSRKLRAKYGGYT